MITQTLFGTTKDGIDVYKYNIANKNGMYVEIITYGGAITNLVVPDKKGKLQDIVTGFDNIASYEGHHPYFGVLVGRFANRIHLGKFALDGENYQLVINNPPNHLHGGPTGFHHRLWDGVIEDESVKLTYISKDGEESYPGEVKVMVTYQLTDENELILDYAATSSKATPINLTNHSYFNLGGHDSGNIYGHLAMVNAERFTPKNKDNVPSGEVVPVSGTMFDLRQPVLLGDRIPKVPVEEGDKHGFDHNFCINGDGPKNLAARISHEESGRVLEVYTTQPGIQFYTANYLPDEGIKGKGGAVYRQHAALCLETQNYPDAINEPKFPSCVLRPGETFRQTTWFKFSTST